MNYLRTDQYTTISSDCPVHIDLHEVDDVVEIALGLHRFDETTLRLVMDHPEVCQRLAAALTRAGDQLTIHLNTKAVTSSLGDPEWCK